MGPYPLIFNSWFTSLAALFSALALLDGNIVGTALSAIPTATLLIVYSAFIPRTSLSNHLLKFLPAIDNIEATVASLTARVVVVLAAVLVAQLFSFGSPSGISIVTILLSGIARALSWYFTIRIIGSSSPSYNSEDRDRTHRFFEARSTSWTVATLIGTFTLLSSRDPFIQSSNFQALSQVMASVIVLGQIIHTLPQPKGKSIIWVFALVSVIPYLWNNFIFREFNLTLPSWTSAKPHPADALIQKSKADFDKRIERQSKSPSEAVREYQRRYGIPPPPGFEKWYEFAAKSNSTIIDEFDTIFENISPFLKFSGNEIARITDELINTQNVELWDCSFTGSASTAMTQCTHPYRSFDRHISNLFDRMIKDLDGIELPKVRFLVNHLDEPRVMFPTQPNDLSLGVTDLSHKPTWDTLTKLCHSNNKTRTLNSWPKYPDVKTYSLPFVTDRLSDMDICQHSEYRTKNGVFVSPTSLRLISGLAPVLSTGAPLSMGDILMPSPAYSESQFQYNPAAEIPWSKKKNNLYWAGSTTGGYASDNSWRSFQRQRFVQKAQKLGSQQHSYIYGVAKGQNTRAQSSFLNSRLYDVSFTRIFQCTSPICRAQRGYFRSKSWASSDAPLASKLAFDIDGNGISGRYYKLLASNSTPLKQTILREWHDERLRAWVHYVPVSQGMEELAELVRYFLETAEGQKRAKEVAEWGSEWFAKSMREVDRSVYLYRLLLELARVQDIKREPMDL